MSTKYPDFIEVLRNCPCNECRFVNECWDEKLFLQCVQRGEWVDKYLGAREELFMEKEY